MKINFNKEVSILVFSCQLRRMLGIMGRALKARLTFWALIHLDIHTAISDVFAPGKVVDSRWML